MRAALEFIYNPFVEVSGPIGEWGVNGEEEGGDREVLVQGGKSLVEQVCWMVFCGGVCVIIILLNLPPLK